MNLSITYTEDQLKQIRAEDERLDTFKMIVRLADDHIIAEKIGFLEYRKMVKNYIAFILSKS